MSGFPTQQQAQARTASLASARLSNGKLGAIASSHTFWTLNLIFMKGMLTWEYQQAPVRIGASIYLLAEHLAYRALSSAPWAPWEVLRKVLGDLNLRRHLISRKYSFAMVRGGLLYL